MDQEVLEKMVAYGVLPEWEVAGWRPAVGESYPTLDTDELVVFASFYYRGFGVLVHPFLRELIATMASASATSIQTPSFMFLFSSISVRCGSTSPLTSIFFATSSA